MKLLKPGHVRVFVAAGSNVEPEKNLAAACAQIAHTWPDTVFSRAYRNAAVGFEGPDFINLVVGFSAAQPLHSVIEKLRGIETNCGRPRYAPKWASRTMDLDVLLFGDLVEKTADYTLPRPDLLKRPYMLGPLAEIAPDVVHPVAGRTIEALWNEFDRDGHVMSPVEIMVPGEESGESEYPN
jgi:2-amino-4-hydroxy-6-hydroxymethyldihydropteridine diphosphokinase